MDGKKAPAQATGNRVPSPPRQGMWALILGLLGLLVAARVAVLVFTAPVTPTAAPSTPSSQAPATAIETPTPAATALTAVRTPSPVPTSTLSPSVTPEILRLAVEEEVLASYRSYFASLPARYEQLELVPYRGPKPLEEVLTEQRASWAIYWSSRAAWGATPLREEPYALIVHPSLMREGFTLAQLTALAKGQDQTLKLVVSDDGKAISELLGLNESPAEMLRLSDWPAVKEYVATHEDAWALIPWDAVDFRVQTLPVEGRQLDPRKLQGYPLLRRLWLGGETAPPRPLLEDLIRALRYEPPATVELVAVGDISFDRSLIQQNSPRYPFECVGLQPLLAGADVTLGHLEYAIADWGTSQAKVMDGLVFAGFDVLSLASYHHTSDDSNEALLDTLRLLREAGILVIGAGENITEAHRAGIIESNGLRLAFLAYNLSLPTSFTATATSPGFAMTGKERMVADVRAARQEADMVIVSCHWGTEHSPSLSVSQQELVQALAEAGAALIVGHHPNGMGGLRYGQNTLTVYSLGNFVSGNLSREASSGVILRCLLDHVGVKTVELVPYASVDNRPCLVSREKGAPIIRNIVQLTREQGTFPKEKRP